MIDRPTQYHTVHTTQTALGPVTETCDITLIPFKAEDGCDLVREDRKCLVQFVPNDAANSNNGGNIGTGNSGNGSNNTDTSGSSTNSSSISPNSGSNGATIVSSGSLSSAASATASSVDSSSLGLGTSAESTNAAQSTGAAAANDNSPTPTSSSPGSSTNSASSTTSPAPDSSQTFTLPGTQLSVLPIGLGVFAGVSVIALIVVGLVTYERTKYRKAFRQRKLAEQGQAPGMSERPTIS
jgi:hypothetical protein